MESVVSKNTEVVFLYVTFPDREIARRIGRDVVESRLAACANIFSDHESIYHWEGAINSETECAVVFKTVKVKLDDLSAYIIKHHPYETPCLAAMSPEQINGPFEKWVLKQTERPNR